MTAEYGLVLDNAVRMDWIPSITFHSNVPGDFVTGTVILHNRLSSNGDFRRLNRMMRKKRTDIDIVAEAFPNEPNPPGLPNTFSIWNTVTNDLWGMAPPRHQYKNIVCKAMHSLQSLLDLTNSDSRNPPFFLFLSLL